MQVVHSRPRVTHAMHCCRSSEVQGIINPIVIAVHHWIVENGYPRQCLFWHLVLAYGPVQCAVVVMLGRIYPLSSCYCVVERVALG